MSTPYSPDEDTRGHNKLSSLGLTKRSSSGVTRARLLHLVLTVMLIGITGPGCQSESHSSQPPPEMEPDEPGWGYVSRIFFEDGARAVLPEGMELRRISDSGLSMVAKFEGFRSQLYHDAAGHCTIGFGHLVHEGNCTARDRTAYGSGWHRGRALEVLLKDLARAELSVQLGTGTTLSDSQFAALCDFAFNCGTGALRKSGVLEHISAGNWSRAAATLRRYVKAGGRVLPVLVERRKAEIKLLLEGQPASRDVIPEDESLPLVDILTD